MRQGSIKSVVNHDQKFMAKITSNEADNDEPAPTKSPTEPMSLLLS